MTNAKLHIISLDVPFPADYGAMIDVFYRCKALKEAGIYIVLHCFEYGRGEHKELNDIANEVFYYHRKRSIWDLFSTQPFIVQSRRSTELLNRLKQDDSPIFFEGQHTCHLLHHVDLIDRKKMVRIHNIEWHYYDLLAHRTKRLINRLFFKWEAKKLKRFDAKLSVADALFCVSHADEVHYKLQHKNVILMPSSSSFERNDTVTLKKYAIYHGNLSVPENEEAALWIIDAFQKFNPNFKLIIAGKNPSKKLIAQVNRTQECELKINPSREEMNVWITEATFQLLITFQPTGIKLKLINSLVQGGICIANQEMVEGTDLGNFCELIASQEELIQAIVTPRNLTSDFHQRNSHMDKHYNPKETCNRVIEVLNSVK